jgi:glycosyltransferase involved in cell wall biosynthesis
MQVWVVIPAFNEEKSIGRVVAEVKKYAPNIIVVNDGSGDKTAEVGREAGAEIIDHIINRGQGAALKTGFNYALGRGAEIIVTFDADGQFLPSEIPGLIRPIAEGEADAVLGSRFITNNSKIPLIRKLVLKSAILFTRITTGLGLSDAHNGFRAFSRKAIELIDLKQDRMAHASEILHEIKRLGLKYKEVPVTVSYTDYSMGKGQSSLNALGILWELLIGKINNK